MQYNEDDVWRHMQPFHDRIWSVIEQGYGEWVAVKRARAAMGISPILYPRTIANYVFDAVARHALREFQSEAGVKITQDAQTVKFCFGSVIVARFKKGDESHLGQNHPTQAVLDFVSQQRQLPGLPPEAAKVEILYSADDIKEELERVVIAARDRNSLLWHYEIGRSASMTGQVAPVPLPISPEDHGSPDDENLVVPRNRNIVSPARNGK